jgi:putative (di)nucleoside polyphosphate hydrolase
MPVTEAIPKGYRPNVGLMLIGPDRRVFVGQRSDTAGPAWQMPQGGVDPGETPVEAACRELEEEVGTTRALLLRESGSWLTYELPNGNARKLWKGRWRGQAQKWFALAFTGSDADINIGTAHPEFSTWKWVRSSELPKLIVPFKRPIYETILREFADLLD